MKKWLSLSLVTLVLLIQIPLIVPFLKRGFFTSHDNFQVQRTYEYYQSLAFGNTLPGWSSGLLFEYGYPIFSFYPPLVYFIGSVFVFSGISFLTATKLTFLLAFVLGAVGFFVLTRELFGNYPALISATVYSLAPYRAVEVYVRGNLAEFWAMSLFPFLFYFNYRLLLHKSGKNWLGLTLCISLLILTHNISTFIYFIFLLLFNLLFLFFDCYNKQRSVVIISLLISVLFALGISCFYWMPLLFERQYVALDNFSQYPYAVFFISLSQLWKSGWGYEGFNQQNSMSLQLGQVIFVSTILVVMNEMVNKSNRLSVTIRILLLTFIIFTFLELKQSQVIWQTVSIFSYIQFPWRFHIVTTTVGSIFVGYLILLIQKYVKQKGNNYLILISVILVFFAISESYSFFRPKLYTNKLVISDTTTWDDEYMPKWVKFKPTGYPINKVNGTEQKNVTNLDWDYTTKKFVVDHNSNEEILISHIYYPGWVVKIDGKSSVIDYSNPGGNMVVSVPSGRHLVEFQYKLTWWRSLAAYISLMFILLLVFLTRRMKNQLYPLA